MQRPSGCPANTWDLQSCTLQPLLITFSMWFLCDKFLNMISSSDNFIVISSQVFFDARMLGSLARPPSNLFQPGQQVSCLIIVTIIIKLTLLIHDHDVNDDHHQVSQLTRRGRIFESWEWTRGRLSYSSPGFKHESDGGDYEDGDDDGGDDGGGKRGGNPLQFQIHPYFQLCGTLNFGAFFHQNRRKNEHPYILNIKILIDQWILSWQNLIEVTQAPTFPLTYSLSTWLNLTNSLSSWTGQLQYSQFMKPTLTHKDGSISKSSGQPFVTPVWSPDDPPRDHQFIICQLPPQKMSILLFSQLLYCFHIRETAK